MAICGWCDKEMNDLDVTSCDGNKVVDELGGLPSVPASHDCHDCNVKKGGFHHPGCDNERCPVCGYQLISCGCLDKEEDEDAWKK